MIKFLRTTISILVCFSGIVISQNNISIQHLPSNTILILIDHEFHVRFGFKYPVTYQIGIPLNCKDLTAEKRYSSGMPWQTMRTVVPGEKFNGIEAARFDYDSGFAYVSVAFDDQSDSLFIKVSDVNAIPVPATFKKVTKYYDDRKAVVTITADDWCNGFDKWFNMLLPLFRSRELYVTCGIITDSTWCSKKTWANIQKQIDSSYIEIASHSRTHPFYPYNNFISEVIGSYDDIDKNLRLPEYSRNQNSQYVYVWIAPRSNYDIRVDTLLRQRSYLIPRRVSAHAETFSGWDDNTQHFTPTYITLELGNSSSGIGGIYDTSILNGTFNAVKSRGGIYHLLWHPQGIISYIDSPFVRNHLDYISKRNDIWYVNLGYLYLYHLVQLGSSRKVNSPTTAGEKLSAPSFSLDQNYPNPFNSSTMIHFHLSAASWVTISVFDVLGRKETTLLNQQMDSGDHDVLWDAQNTPSGVYYYRMSSEKYSQIKKMVVIK
ncbi:MAG: T9SS type A sorting domain-containing protein [Bacteroidota bacterium]